MGARFEMHFHTEETSPCGKVPAAQAVEKYRESGYTGIVVTDHYFRHVFDLLPGDTWAEKWAAHSQGYRAAKAAGDACGMTVLHGIEWRSDESANDYLVYGMTEQDFLENPEMYRLMPAEMSALCRKKGWLFFQAHPFREGLYRLPAELLDGVEVFNGNLRHNSHDDEADAYCAAGGLLPVSGSDFHEWEDFARGGVEFDDPVNSMETLVASLRARRYRLIRP